MTITTNWGRITPSDAVSRYLRGTHSLWGRISGAEKIFTVLPNDQIPSEDAGGYRSIETALTVKGMFSRLT